MVVHVTMLQNLNTCVTVVLNSLDRIVKSPLITVCSLVPTVTMEPVWMDLVPLSASVIWDILETFATSTLTIVQQLDARMEHVEI